MLTCKEIGLLTRVSISETRSGSLTAKHNTTQLIPVAMCWIDSENNVSLKGPGLSQRTSSVALVELSSAEHFVTYGVRVGVNSC